MDLHQQQVDAIDRLADSLRASGWLETDPVDFVEFLIQSVAKRDLDALADDVLCFVLGWDDLRQHVRDRLDVLRAFTEAQQPQDQHRAATNIVAAIRAIVTTRLRDRGPRSIEGVTR